MNPEEIMILKEESKEQSDQLDIDQDLIYKWLAQERNSFDSVAIGDLIEANIRFRMLSEDQGALEEIRTQKELNMLKEGWFDRSLIEGDYGEVPRGDMEFDEFDPPFETKCARWACPYGEREITPIPSSQENQPRDPVTRAIALSDRIYSMSSRDLVRDYFKLGLTRFPKYLRDFLQTSIEDKIKPLLEEVTAWKNRNLLKAKDEFEEEAIKEKVQIATNKLNRILLREDPTIQEFNPIIEDQGVQTDKRWTRQEVERLNHIEGEEFQNRSENQDWVHRMWDVQANLPDGDLRRNQKAHDGLVKNMSGEEARYLKRNKDDREFRLERILAWVERQTSGAGLQKGLQKLNQLYRQSISECVKRQNFAEIRYTKAQRAQVTEAITIRQKEIS